MRRIGVLTSGGDGPGLNPCIRAVVRTALGMGMSVMGVRRGYSGLIGGEIEEMTARSVGGIIGRGGTILGTSRSPEFATPQGQLDAMRNMNRFGIEGLVVIGGNGSLTGALKLHERGVKVIGLPGTIDNDLGGSDTTIGVDTTLNTILDAIDKIKDTASSHQRAFLVETMGRGSGYLAIMSSIAGGAEMALIPERAASLEDVSTTLKDAYIRGKTHCIIVVAEGWKPGIKDLDEFLNSQKAELGFEVRTIVLGHIQRGGSPSAYDRILATRLGAAAVEALSEGESGLMIGWVGDKFARTPLTEVIKPSDKVKQDLLKLEKLMEK
ncbi:MAG TPA: 6-phosphofructokinase [Anaerolineae bacterium]